MEFSEQGERTLRSVESSVIEFSEQGERTLRSVESSVRFWDRVLMGVPTNYVSLRSFCRFERIFYNKVAG
ncbi:hypothetical protein QMM42_17450 [Leptospira santarosai]|uniref:hypothetical protein n=1 Tax=Leptospira santarosai TaxID=28183 RepID=UPI0024B000E7|nr:hypothetical protein [Leptospira santarosai]MDI7187959.1 hypothetical protein [Leptospira santarosai]